jgi:hypothetical protein
MSGETKEIYVTEKEAARELAMSVDWLRKRRRLRQPPSFCKFGNAVRYPLSGLNLWASSQRQELSNQGK